ncbi:MAG: DUF4290 domain-containing protein [Bacteroidales bacterium]
MEYNTTRGDMKISEYGRNIQNMILYIASLPDREQRNKLTATLVNILAIMNPDMRDQVDIRHKLYDHVHLMSDFTLDIDSPYPVPPRPEEAPRPARVPYTQENIKLRPYGKYMQRMIEKAVQYPDGEEKDELVKTLANNLKKMYLNWNRDSVNDELIHEHLSLLSGTRLKLRDDDRLHSTTDILKANKQLPDKQKQPFKRRKFSGKKNENNNGRQKKYGKS